MQDRPGSTRVPPNPKHARQVFWQILFPLIMVAAVILAATVLVVLASASGGVSAGQLASVSIIWMIAPLIIIGGIFLLVTAGVIFLTARVIKIVPVYTRLIQVWVQIFGLRIEQILDLLARPVIRTRSLVTGLKALWRKFWRI